MDIQQLWFALEEIVNQYSQYKEAIQLKQIFSLSQYPIRDQHWCHAVHSFINTIKTDYPTFNYYLGKYWNGKNEKVDFQTMNDYLLIAGLCVVNELFIETHKR